MRRFPIQGGPAIPWVLLAPHERQARSNHGGQSLERLADRGGLSPCEALAVLEDRPWRRMPPGEAAAELGRLLEQSSAVRAEELRACLDGLLALRARLGWECLTHRRESCDCWWCEAERLVEVQP